MALPLTHYLRNVLSTPLMLRKVLHKGAAIAFLTATFGGLTASVSFTTWAFQPAPSALRPLCDLSGSWETCFSEGPEPDLCAWHQLTHLPGRLDSGDGFSGWVHYRRSFTLPEPCGDEGCALLLGDVVQAARASINGHAVGEGGIVPPARSPTRLYPVALHIPQSALGEQTSHQAQISVYAPKAAKAGVTKAPLQIVRAPDARAFAKAHSTGAIFVPLAIALALTLIAGALALYAVVNTHEDSSLLLGVGLYCLANITFLVSFADQFYDWIPMNDAVAIRYTARRANDIALAYIFWVLLEFKGVPRRFYGAAFAGICLIGLSGACYVWQQRLFTSNPLVVVAAVSAVTRATWQIKFAAPTAALVAAAWDWREPRRHLQILGLVALLGMFAYDSAIFWGFQYGDYASRFHVLILACLFAGLIVRRAAERSTQLRLQYQAEAEIGRAARQVAHDIRSPLAALTHALTTTTGLAEDSRILLRSATGRINDIANSLLTRGPKDREAGQDQRQMAPILSVLQLLDLLVTEQRMQHRARSGATIEFVPSPDAHQLFVQASATELQRAISNLVNNGVEALPARGSVVVSLASGASAEVRIEVRDNGCGIPQALLERLGQRGQTFGKSGGSGLGLAHAKEFAEMHGGALRIQSEQGEGTAITLILPRSAPPCWYIPEVRIPTRATVVVLDDDESIHAIWKHRLTELSSGLKQVHLFTPDELTDFVSERASQGPCVYLVDYELLGFQQTGLDLIEVLGLASQAVLVTSRADEEKVQRRCGNLAVKLLPKAIAGHIPLTLQPILAHVDAVILDDDALIHHLWSMVGKERSKNFVHLSHPRELTAVLEQATSSTPVFVDFHLAGAENGDRVTARLAEAGFTRIYLMTGMTPEHLPAMPWITAVVGKNPPDWL